MILWRKQRTRSGQRPTTAHRRTRIRNIISARAATTLGANGRNLQQQVLLKIAANVAAFIFNERCFALLIMMEEMQIKSGLSAHA